MSLAQLSVSTQNYLKIIWSITEHASDPATTSAIAARAGLRLSSVSDAVKRLAAANLVEHQPYGAIELTETGRDYALQVIRRHRLIETFLVQTLGYTWDQVHDEAEVLEHAVSDLMIERIDTVLGHPTRDPHGDPIPSPTGEVERLSGQTLAGASRGQSLLVDRISDDDPELLRYLSAQGVGPGVLVKVQGRDTAGHLTLVPTSGRPFGLSPQGAAAVFVAPAQEPVARGEEVGKGKEPA